MAEILYRLLMAGQSPSPNQHYRPGAVDHDRPLSDLLTSVDLFTPFV